MPHIHLCCFSFCLFTGAETMFSPGMFSLSWYLKNADKIKFPENNLHTGHPPCASEF